MHLPAWLQLLIWLCVIALVCGVLTKYSPMNQIFRAIIIAVGVIIALMLVLQFFGMI